jgi:hypothetical protein
VWEQLGWESDDRFDPVVLHQTPADRALGAAAEQGSHGGDDERAAAGGEVGDGVLEAAPPFLAWRALVLACPRFYPDLPGDLREALLGWAGRVAAHDRFDPALAEELFP